MNRLIKITVMALLLFAVLSGCSKLNREHYDKIKAGMDFKQVISIVGEPNNCSAVMGIKTCVWGNETKNITIVFMGDKVFVPSMKGL